MADNKQALELLFKVAGGSSISGETGKLISGQLEDLSKKIKLKIRVDEEYFSKQVDKLKADIQKKIGTVEVNFKTKEVSTGESRGKASSSTQKDTAAEESFKRAKKYLAERQKIQKQLNKLDVEGVGNEVTWKDESDNKFSNGKILTEQFKTLSTQIGDIDSKFNNAKAAADGYDKALYNLQKESTEAETAQKDLFKANLPEQTRSASIGFKGVVANVKTLGERYSDIINSNKKAAATWEDLQKLAEEPWKGEDHKADDGTQVSASLAAGKKQTQELAKRLKDAAAQFAQLSKESDTFGGKVKKAFSTKLVQYFAAALSGILIRALNQVYQNVVKLDAAITDLQIATGKTRKETGELVKQYAELAKELGATVLEVTDAADTWLRQGYDVADTNELITNTMMLSKLGQIDAAEAAKALTSAMRGYKKEVADASSIVDKFTAVDMRAAVSAGDIATAMAETATGADIAGVSMDKLIGYIATVAEVTQDGAESVGTFYKTLFARMGNVKAGKFTDDETGESLNDVESVLHNVGVELRDNEGLFRNFGDVLDEVAGKWNTYDNVQQHAIATALAGTRQQEKLIVLLSNYGNAIEYANVAATSTGTAARKYQEAYLDSIDAKLNRLEASWQKFSSSILDSALIKKGADFTSSIVEWLTKAAEVGDGMLATIPAITVALLAMYGVLSAIKKTTVFTSMWGGLKNILSIIPAVIAQVKAWALAISGSTAATKAATAASAAWKAVSPLGWAMLAAAAIYGLIKAVQKYANAANAAAEAAKEKAKASLEAAQNAAKQAAELRSLIAEYEELAKGETDLSKVSAETRLKLLDIQAKINQLTGTETQNVALVNGKYDERLETLREIYSMEAKSAGLDAIGAYKAAKEATGKASEKGEIKIPGVVLTEKGQFFLERGKDAGSTGNAIANILSEVGGFDVNRDISIGFDKYYWVTPEYTDARDMVEKLNEAIAIAQERGVNYGVNYDALVGLRDSYQAYLDNESEAANTAVESFVAWLGSSESPSIENLEDYDDFRERLINAVTEDSNIAGLMADGAIASKDITNAVDNWLAEFYPKWYDEKANSTKPSPTKTLKSFLDILSELEQPFDALKSVLDDIEETGIAGADSISALLQNYEGLEKYFTKTENDYVLGDAYKDWSMTDVLRDYVNGEIQKYRDELAKCEEGTDDWNKAQENLNNAIAVGVTLLRSSELEEETDKLNKQKDALSEQLEKFKDIIDVRKDLLKTYKEELDYQKELQKKQESVADLQTQLSLARLDNSAAGQAKVRELEQELSDAQEELDSFTVEHAIDRITAELDDEYGAYETFIRGQIEIIEDAIDNLSKKFGGETNESSGAQESTSPSQDNENNQKSDGEASKLPKLSQSTIKNEKNTGVGDGIRYGLIKGAEDFGQYGVITPTTPSVVKSAQQITAKEWGGKGNSVNYNSPLVQITCGDVTKESLPGLNKIAQDATQRLLNSGMSRTGYRPAISFKK